MLFHYLTSLICKRVASMKLASSSVGRLKYFVRTIDEKISCCAQAEVKISLLHAHQPGTNSQARDVRRLRATGGQRRGGRRRRRGRHAPVPLQKVLKARTLHSNMLKSFETENSGARFTKYLTTILRLSYDNAKVTIDLRRASNLQNILRRTQGLSSVRLIRKIVRSSEIVLVY